MTKVERFFGSRKDTPLGVNKVLLCLIFLSLQVRSYSLPADSSLLQKNIFAVIARAGIKNRVEKANDLYKANFRKVSPAIAMAGLDELTVLARSLRDKVLECAVFEMRADYYSVNLGFNSLSTGYYQKAVDFATANNLPVQRGYYLHRTGMYYSVFKHNDEACRYFLRSQSAFADAGYNHVPDISLFLSQVGDFYYALGDYENARANLVSALNNKDERQHDKINILNTIGLTYRNTREFPQAINYFEKTAQLATMVKDTAWIGIARGNIGSVYFLQNQYQKSFKFIQEDYRTSIKYNELGNGAIALLRLIKINIDQNNLNLAQGQLETAGRFLLRNGIFDKLPIATDYYDLRSQLAEKQGQTALAMAFRKTFETDKDSLIKRNNIAAVERVKLRYEIDQHNAEVTKLKTDARIQSVKTKSAIVVMILLAGIAALWYNNQRIRTRKDKELLLSEKRRVDEDLKNAEAALNDFTDNMRQKNILLETFKAEIEKLQSLPVTNAIQLEQLLQAHIMTDENWQDFRKLFSKVYPGFFVNLSKMHPLLSATDTRVLALLKLGLSNSEMANMMGITAEGIQKAKQRLRKKMDINTIADIGDAFSDD